MTGIVIVAFIILVVVALMYNGLVHKRNQAENAFSTMDVYLKMRYDLIPNLVATVKGYAEHERGVLERITELRAEALKGTRPSDETVALNNQISQALFDVMAVVENYPQLKADGNFMHLQRSLNEVEEQISAARRAFNAAVTDLNNAVQMFPSNLLASATGFTTRRLFEIPHTERRTPKVKEMMDGRE